MLFERIKADRLAAMKARDEIRKNLLGTLLAAAAKDAKEPGDAQVVKTIRIFLAAIEETIAKLAGRDAGRQELERDILAPYLPRRLDEAETRTAVAAAVAGLADRSPKSIGAVMARLKVEHEGRIDMGLASRLAREALAA